MASEGTIIRLTDYNNIRNKIVNILGVGSGALGYGQTVQSSQVPAHSRVIVSQWDNLRFDIVNIWKHQYGEIPSLPDVRNLNDPVGNNEGAIIRANATTAPYTQYDTVADQLTTNRFALATNQSITRNGESPSILWTRSFAASWSAQLSCTVTVSWPTAEAARFFFNSGSEIRFNSSRTGGANTTQNTSWSTLLTSAGTKRFAAQLPSTGFTPLNGQNFYRLTSTPTVWTTDAGSISNTYRISASTSDPAGQVKTVTFLVEWIDGYIGIDDAVSGTIALDVSTLEASGNLEPAGSGMFAVTSPTITLSEIVSSTPTAPLPVYAIVPTVNNVNEGSSVTFNVNTSNVPDNTTLYWTTEGISGIVNTSDFTDGQISGSFVINSGSGSIVRGISADATTEGSESFRIRIATGSTSGTIVATSATVTINDTSTTPPATTYVSFNGVTDLPDFPSVINEGEFTATFTLITANLPNGTVVYWTTEPPPEDFLPPTANDFTDGQTQGTVTIQNNTATIVRSAVADQLTEGTEVFRLGIRETSFTSPVVIFSNFIGISDTSRDPPPVYTVTPTTNDVNEGSSLTFNVSTANVSNGTTLYWTVTNAGDFNISSGSFTINNNAGSFFVTPTADLTTEGPETFTASIRTGSTSGTIVATSVTVTINDTSTAPPPAYSITPSSGSVNEGSSVTFNVSTSNVPDNTTLYWSTQTISGTVNTSDFTDGQISGSFTINNNTGTIARGISADATTEGAESFRISIRTGSTSGTIVADSATVTINDTSITATPSYSVSRVISGLSVTYTITTTNFSGTLYWTNSGTTVAADFTDGVNSGSFAISGSATVVRTIRSDADINTSRTIIFEVRTVSTSGSIVATAPTVTITPPTLNASFFVATSNFIYTNGFVKETKATSLTGSYDFTAGGTQSYSLSLSAGLTRNTGLGTFFFAVPQGSWGSGANTSSQFVLIGPHASGTATLTVTRTGYQDQVITISVSANSVYSPYNFSRGFPQEFSSLSSTERSYAATIASTYYESISTPFTVTVPGLFTTWYGLARRADAPGVAYWGRFCTEQGITPNTQLFINSFFGAVNAAGPGNASYDASRLSSKPFREDSGYDKFEDRP